MPEGSPTGTHTDNQHTNTNMHEHIYTHYLGADRGCPTKAGLLLVITIRCCPHSPHDSTNTETQIFTPNEHNIQRYSAVLQQCVIVVGTFDFLCVLFAGPGPE